MERFAIVNSLDRKKWERFVCDHPKGSVFHTPEMYEVFQGTKNYSPLILAALGQEGDVLALLLAVRVQTLPDPFGQITTRSILYAEPLCQDTLEGEEALAAIIAAHDSDVKDRVLFAEIRPLCPAGREKGVLEEAGYVCEDYLNYVVDLTRPVQDLWKRMTSENRRRINHDAKKGLEIREVTTPEGVDMVYDFLRLTYTRARVPLADKSLFAEAVERLGPNNQVRISAAYYEGKPVGATISLLYRPRFFSWYAGASRIPSLNPMEDLAWREIEWAQAQGFAVYDFGGAGWPNQPYGVRDFKAKFGGDLVQYGRYRKVYSPWKLAAAERAYGLLRKVTNPTQWNRPMAGVERQAQ
jgi:serine/alanine adding enzyme